MSAPPDIFLSYSRDDQARAKLFAEAFEREGFRVWWDVGLRAGEAYDTVTETALKTAKAVVVLWSKRSVESRWVRAEATLADRNRTLVPAMIEACERPLMFELTQTAELMHWQGDAGDKGWRGFLADVKRFVARELAPEVPTIPMAAPSVAETLKPGQSGAAPSLAVLPFTNRSANPDDEFFAEGMVEDVISALSQGVNVRVLGSSATANLGRSSITDVAAIGRQLGVRYLLEGNVRRTGQSLRVTTQLLEAATGEVVWTGRFDRPLAELASLQEELVTEVAGRLDTQIYNLEMARALLKKPSDLSGWEAVARSLSAYRRFDAASIQLALEEAERAVSIAPDFGIAHANLAVQLAHHYLFMPEDAAEVRRIRATVARALELAPENAVVLAYAGHALRTAGYAEDGVHLLEKAVEKAPGSGLARFCLASCLCRLQRFPEALSALETALRLMPGSHMQVYARDWQAISLEALGRLEEAKAASDAALALNPDIAFLHFSKARICFKLGLETEAHQHVKIAKRQGLTVEAIEQVWLRLLPRRTDLVSDIARMKQLFAAVEAGG
jgi:TolB-like protein/Tfp pilus assembly protein PilF